jgi:hypothetical protein
MVFDVGLNFAVFGQALKKDKQIFLISKYGINLSKLSVTSVELHFNIKTCVVEAGGCQ